MTDWRGIGLTGIVMMVVGQIVHTVESAVTIGYYMDPTYFGVWSRIMMPAAGPPPAAFYAYSIGFGLVSWAIFGYVYARLGRAVEKEAEGRRGLEFGVLIFLVAGIPGALTMYLLINLPAGLLASWILSQLILYLIGGAIAARLINLNAL